MDGLCFTFLCIVHFVTNVVNSETDTQPLLHYDLLYESGLEAYHEEKWSQCVAFLEKAVSDYHHYKKSLTDCRIQCKRKSRSHNIDVSHVDIQKLELIQRTVFESNCVQKCKQKTSGDRFLAGVDPLIDEDFIARKPYDYLQFCYYKSGRVSDAASAAYTYFLANPKHEETIDNLHYYRSEESVQDSHITDFERKPYQTLYIKGSNAHSEELWSDVIDYFEQAIKEYYSEEEHCRAACEDMYDVENLPEDFKYLSITDVYIRVISCQYECEDKLNHLYVEKIPDFVPEHYNYLQYAYHNLENYDKAVEAVATYLLFIPDNEDLLANKVYYLKKMGYHEGHFMPREEAVRYHKNREMMKKILKYADQLYSSSDNENDSVSEQDDTKNILPPFGSKHNLKFSKSGGYMKWYESMGVKLVAEKKDLKGLRVVADGFCREEQCQELMLFANLMEPNERGVRVMNISDALQAVKQNEEYDISLRLFLRAAEISRHFSSHYFNKSTLFVKDAKLVCREPQDTLDTKVEDCIEQEDGNCYKDEDTDDDTLQNELIALAYLQDLEEDGDTYFSDRYGNKQTSVSLKCGRVVVFKASDRHGIENSKSQRCSLYARLTTDREKDDQTQRKAMEYLINLDKSQHNASNTMNNSEYIKHFKEQGVSVAMSGEDLKGKERFVADGLANEEQCGTLIELAKKGALPGDGYFTERENTTKSGIEGDGYDKEKEKHEQPVSPHTIHETFEGLTVSRAVKLAHIQAIEQSSVHLFMDLSEKGRLLVEKYFNLTRPLYFDFTHLVCRTAIEGDSEDREGDLSHPVHADNCNLQPDGSCTRVHPAYTQRDYSAILYLNDAFDGGEFFFAHANKSEQVTLKPKCGRLVGFNAGEFHGVKPVLKGQRCAIAMWYTFDPNHKELAHIQARKMLKMLSKNLPKPSTEVHEEL